MGFKMLRVALGCFTVYSVLALAAKGYAQPKFQYESEGISVSIPTSDEPKIEQFGTQSLTAAAKYLEAGALSWARDRGCVNCHTTGPYLVERSAWSRQLGLPNEEVLESFRKEVPSKISVLKEAEKNGHRFYPGAFSSVWRSLGLAEWDRHITKSTSEWTDRSLQDMFERQSSNGSFVSHGEVEIPYITTDFELSLQAARAITSAPGWLQSLNDPVLIAKVDKLKQWLRTAQPKNDFDRVLRLRLHNIMPDLVSDKDREEAIQLLTSKQHTDGGWSTRDMSAVDDWHFEVSAQVRKLINGMPDASKPESDAYMTALAIVLLRQADVPASDPRIQSGLKWLKQEQRVSGRWWMHSLYRGNYHYTTYIATIEAIKALDLCGELPPAL
jgi:squalene-hopene/tetraprenyl-beta-curcumene cyclase